MTTDDFENEQADFAEHYSAMSDAELLAIALHPWALEDAAWDALEDELESRNLEVPEPELPPAISSLEKRNLVMLRRFRDIPEALLAKGRLESFGIECFLGDENMVRMDWFLSNLLGGIKLLVDAENFTEAAKILNESVPEHLDDADE